jgi:hydrogenase maturation protease
VSAVLTILGIGSPFGDDRAGWSAAEQLARSARVANSAGRIEVRMLDRPGSLLLAEFGESNGVILVDALCTGALPGTIRRLEADAVCAARSLLSSHGLGVAQAVGLARSLGCLPARFVFFGIEADWQSAGAALSPAVTAALPQLVEQVIQQAEVWLEFAPAASGGAVR